MRLRAQARTFFDAELDVVAESEREGTLDVEVARAGNRGRVRVRTSDVDEATLAAGRAAAAAIGGAGFDVLVERTRAVMRLETVEGDARAALVVAAVLASITLGPILAPDGAIFGVRGARMRLEGA